MRTDGSVPATTQPCGQSGNVEREYDERRFAMLLKSEWAERFINTCAKVKSARRRVLAASESVYLTEPKERCWVVASGYVRLGRTAG